MFQELPSAKSAVRRYGKPDAEKPYFESCMVLTEFLTYFMTEDMNSDLTSDSQ